MFDQQFHALANASGSPVDYIKLFVCLLVSFPLASAFLYLPSPTVKHIYSLLVSTIFFLPILQLKWGFVQLLSTSLATYFICLNKIGGRNMPWIVFFLEMGHLTCNHIYRQFGNIPLTTIEITSMQMVLTMNLTTFAWDCFDGQIRSLEECDDSQKKTRIVQMPNLLEFLGYVFYFPGVLIGPSTRFSDYMAWSTGAFFTTPKGKEKVNENVSKSPRGRVPAALQELAVGLGFMAVYAIFAGKYSYEKMIGANGGFEGYTWYGKIGHVLLAGFFARTKYYGIWSLTNGACILSGLGFNGINPRTGQTMWNRCRNVDILAIEFANNWKELLDAWNMNTNVWLRNNVYKRIARPGKRPGFKSTMTTFMTSAFWHGLAPGYYLTFLFGGLMQSSARTLRKHVRPLFFKDPRTPNPTISTLTNYTVLQLIYSAVSIAFVQLTLSYSAVAFMLLDFNAALRAWRSVYWYGHVLYAVSLLAFRVGLGKYLDAMSGRPRQPRVRVHLNGGATSGATTATESDGEALSSNGTRKSESQEPKIVERVTSLAPEPIS